jgi:asparagine synthase (glutamine-hydrolysing)
MCGIAGYLSWLPTDVPIVEKVLTMGKIMEHRGPDGEGLVVFAGAEATPLRTAATPIIVPHPAAPHHRVATEAPETIQGALLHRRLSIIDLSTNGHQPFADPSGRYWFVFNGEIYNYKELKHQLRNEGISWVGETDAEVAFHWLLREGWQALHRFDGMFAFALYDAQTQTLTAARDRLGVKPFYYIHHPSGFAFASEQKALHTLQGTLGFDLRLRQEAVWDYLVAGRLEHEEEGFFHGLMELFPGDALVVSARDHQPKVMPWYRFEPGVEADQPGTPPTPERAAALRDVLQEAVALRLRSDVPVGSCLSGGLDSSALVALMRTCMGPASHLPVFTAAFEGLPIDESTYAQEVALAANAAYHGVTPDAEGLVKDFDDLVWAQDIPIWSTSTYAQYSLMRRIAQNGIRVVLDGQGGDELFGGYPHHLIWYGWGQAAQNPLFPFTGWPALQHPSGALKPFLVHGIDRMIQNQGLMQPALVQRFPHLKFVHPDFREGFRSRWRANTPMNLAEGLREETHRGALKRYLKCEDRCSMRFSVESRTPFSDSKALLAFAAGLSGRERFEAGRGKALLREALSPLLPASITARRDKMGFVTPHKMWYGLTKGKWEAYLHSEHLRPYLSEPPERLAQTLHGLSPLEADNGRWFRFVCLAAWLKMKKI